MTHYQTKKVLKYIKKGSVSKLRSFLKKNDVNLNEIRDSENKGVLHLSSYLGECKMSRFLLRCGVDPCLTDSEGNTPIHIALKYALEFNNESVFLNLILPLKKKSKRVMNLANQHGETPGDLYDKLKTALRQELSEKNEVREDNGKSRRGMNEETNHIETKRVERQEEQDWFEKLAFEEACEDFYFKDDYESRLEEEQGESYNQWAERIRCEYSTKHHRITPAPTTRGSEKEKTNRLNETLTKTLAKEHEAYVNGVKLKRTERQKKKYEENCQNVFESGSTDQLTFESIPWPVSGSAADIVDKLSEWAGEDKIGYLKIQRVRWHPDRFAQRCRHRITDAERVRIMDLVKQISQGINMMISSL
mgnify:FL=1